MAKKSQYLKAAAVPSYNDTTHYADATQYRIGDGIYLTAGHAAFEYNHAHDSTPLSITTSDIITQNGTSDSFSILNDFRGYRSEYASQVATEYSGSSPGSNEHIEGYSPLVSKDTVMISGSGSVRSSDAGLVLFFNPGDMTSIGSVLTGSSIFRDSYVSGVTTGGSVTSVSGNNFTYNVAAVPGDSGGAYLLNYNGRDFVIGTVDTSISRGTYFLTSEWDSIHNTLAANQVGNVTSKEPTDLLVGSGSADTMVGSYRADIVLGGGGGDLISDGESSTSTAWGNDTLVGGAGSDTFIANQGNDILWGGDEGSDTSGDTDTATYVSSKPIAITFDGTTSTPVLTVRDGYGGSDTLHSIEQIVGTLANDQLRIVGAIPTGTNLTIDANPGLNPNPGDSINMNQASANTTIVNTGSGPSSISTAGGGQISLVGFHTQIIGSDYNDDISDDTSGRKRIDGGAGDDTISMSGTSSDATLIGDSGNDTITGGDGNDVIIPDAGTVWVNEDNDIYGGDGSDFIVSASVGNAIYGGDGADYIKLLNSFSPTGGGPYRGLYITGGEGNDVIDAAGNLGFTLNFGALEGHDTIISTVTTVNSSIDIHLEDLDPEDLTLKWDVPNDGNYHTGDLAIIVNSTGASIFIPQVRGYVGTGNQATSQYHVEVSFDHTQMDTRDGFHVEFGDVSEYNVGSADFDEATELSSGDTTGTSGDDFLIGGSGDDSLSGGEGDDNFTASYGNDTIAGGDGNDSLSLVGSRSDYAIVQDGGDIVVTSLRGTEGEITLTSVENLYFLYDNDTYSTEDLFGYNGTSGADNIVGSYFDNTIDALAGNDTIAGLDGNDTIDGGDGIDTADYTGSSSDYFATKQGDGSFAIFSSSLDAETGTDILVNVEQAYFAGDDITILLTDQNLTGTSGADTLTAGFGDDSLTGLAGNDNLDGLSGNDTISGGNDDDTLIGGDGDDILDGGDGSDTAQFAGSSDGYLIARELDGSLTVANWFSGDNDGYDTLTNIEALHFAGDDITLGINDIPELGTSGADTITGSARPDRLLGFSDDDSLTGGAGSDELDGGEGADSMIGGDGDDYYYVDNAGDVVVENADEGYDSVYSTISYTIGSNIEDLYLWGEDSINGTGNALDNYISGNDSDNVLSGQAGGDSLDGYAGADTLVGGSGDDYLYGGDGSDTAVYAGNSAGYTITTNDGSVQIVDDAPSTNGDDGTDTLYDVEHAQFSNETVNLATPIILDLNGDGVNLIERDRSHTKFDWDGDGKGNKTGWINKDDGLLVFDRNGDGKVSDASELSFVGDKPGAKSDLDGLSAFDSNDDGLFSAADAEFANFRVWRDKNGNGKSDKRELMTLEQAGIASITLAGTAVNQNWNWDDNLIVNTGAFTRIDGSQGGLADVALNYDDDKQGKRRYAPSIAASRFAEAIAAFGGRGADAITLDKHNMELSKIPVFAGNSYNHI